MLTLGIDDAGRGPVLGSMFLAGVLLEKDHEAFLKKQGVTDSKLLFHFKRVVLAKVIEANCEDFHIVKASANDIDFSIIHGINLNTLEAMKTAEIINKINNEKRHKEKIKVIVDCPSTNIVAWRNKLITFVKHINNLEVICEHKADFNHPSVSAASILAKVEREKEIEKIKEQYKNLGNPGSGYPGDPSTQEFLKKHGKELKDSGIFRKTWSTWKIMFPEKLPGQASLKDFK
ncbi:ribonuclease HII [Candidatus Pacearchaeota archaeon]|nr:ribonuclease HII [Candidatus Pacearchaeota archaeon]